jgi:hypothetical protein
MAVSMAVSIYSIEVFDSSTMLCCAPTERLFQVSSSIKSSPREIHLEKLCCIDAKESDINIISSYHIAIKYAKISSIYYF